MKILSKNELNLFCQLFKLFLDLIWNDPATPFEIIFYYTGKQKYIYLTKKFRVLKQQFLSSESKSCLRISPSCDMFFSFNVPIFIDFTKN